MQDAPIENVEATSHVPGLNYSARLAPVKKPPRVIMGKTHTNILHRFGYHRTKSRKRKGLFKKIKDTEYCEHAKGYSLMTPKGGSTASEK